MPKIFLGSDHAGYNMKEKVKKLLDDEGIIYEDMTPELDEKDDYPDAAEKVAKKVSKGEGEGILICGTGMGVSIAANKIKGVRAARAASIQDAKLAKQHNNANILTFAGRASAPSTEEAKRMIKAWLNSENRKIRKIITS